jgi:hypothetical protein
MHCGMITVHSQDFASSSLLRLRRRPLGGVVKGGWPTRGLLSVVGPTGLLRRWLSPSPPRGES